MKTLIKNVRIVDGGEIQSGHILVENRRISAILPLGAEIDEGIVYDFSGLYASAGFIDTYTHENGTQGVSTRCCPRISLTIRVLVAP